MVGLGERVGVFGRVGIKREASINTDVRQSDINLKQLVEITSSR